jgi:hypothetical protein
MSDEGKRAANEDWRDTMRSIDEWRESPRKLFGSYLNKDAL